MGYPFLKIEADRRFFKVTSAAVAVFFYSSTLCAASQEDTYFTVVFWEDPAAYVRLSEDGILSSHMLGAVTKRPQLKLDTDGERILTATAVGSYLACGCEQSLFLFDMTNPDAPLLHVPVFASVSTSRSAVTGEVISVNRRSESVAIVKGVEGKDRLVCGGSAGGLALNQAYAGRVCGRRAANFLARISIVSAVAV